ncbi:flagellar basal-body MS-ring/collar protein FliF [Lentibacter algarum]|uniref:flagellar basal-body MS-ring/collar protein FliF n=1 Tax=Lentibacter algarum TaxID=576131 RepID=UPI0020905DAC|nr:flagellar basal-body MS-ring/collar protein FliF [Lentibacter algarum]
MEQLQNVFASADLRRKIIAGLAAAGMFAAILAMTNLASSPSLTLLYTGLESSQAGEVVKSLEQRGVQYEVRGGSIFVESAQRDALRMTLASEGLPANNTKGYELLDSLNGFGTTSQMFDAAYWRAKEGELARTIAASPLIASARVHIANSSRNPFQKNAEPTASVSVTSVDGSLPSQHAKALRYLIASAVAGLSAENVSVIDDKGGLIGATDENTSAEAGQDKAQMLRARVQNLLEARVGYGNAVVEVSVDTVTETESIRETRIDPESRIAISTDTEERSGNSTDSSGGDVTVASNLPDGAAAGAGDGNTSQNTETRERVNYEVSETFREVLRTPGAIKRMSVAVLVNGSEVANDAGEAVFEPRAEAELADLKELVASAVGFNEARGDIITIKSLQFQPVDTLGTEATSSFMSGMNIDAMSLIQMAVLALVSLVLGLFVLRPILTKSSSAELPPPALALPSAGDSTQALTGEIDDGSLPATSAMALNNGSGLPAAASGEDPVERLRTLIGERQDETVEILRNWLENKEESA